MARYILCLFLLLPVLNLCHGAKILGVFHMPSPSHYILGSALMRGLAEAGHEVTVISAFGEKSVPKHWKYRDIVLEGFLEELEVIKKQMFERAGGNPFLGLPFLSVRASKYAEMALEYDVVKDLLQSGEKFDVVIIEQFVNDAFKALGPYFGAPIVVLSTLPANLWINPLVGNPTLPAFVPDVTLSYPPRMHIWQRTYNTIVTVYNWLVIHFIQGPLQDGIVSRHFPDVEDWINSAKYNVSLVLVNSHVSISQPVPLTPNMIEIGGFHLQPPKKLPEDLQVFLDNAKEGVVYFSMGSNLKSKYLPTEKRDAILKAFSKLKCKVLWKWENDTLPGKPDNVMVKSWFPQQSILAHPNMKLFITHGGLLSTIETVYHGVPILAIPIFGDQESNAAKAIDSGYGLKVAFRDLEEEIFYNAIMEMLNNPKYGENAKIRSVIMHDRPMKPIDEAIFWVEYVIRHKGAVHFRSAAIDLKWYEYLLFDVILLLIGLVMAGLSLLELIQFLLCNNSNTETEDSTNKDENKVDKIN